MIFQTRQQRWNTEYALNVMWPAIPPERVTDSLLAWRCGAAACFGGHCAVDPEFAKQGVYMTRSGAPGHADCDTPAGVSFMLFGDPSMFVSRSCAELAANPSAFSHKIVSLRLERLLGDSKVQNDTCGKSGWRAYSL